MRSRDVLTYAYEQIADTFPGTVEVDGDDLIINGTRIKVTAERDPANLPHKELGVDLIRDPAMANKPNIAAEVLALFLKRKEIKIKEAQEIKLIEEITRKSKHIRNKRV